MKRNIVPVLLASAFLIGCNNGMPSVDEATAIECAATILQHQKADDFVAPNCFTINFHNNKVGEEYDPRSQVLSTFEDLTQDFIFNFDKLACREHNVRYMTSESGIVNDDKDVYRFYDKANETYYVISDSNGFKEIITEKKMTEEEAKTELNKRRQARFAVLKFQQVIGNFKNIVDNTNALIEKFKDSKEEFAHINYASRDDKSLKVDYGYKQKDSIISPYKCDGFHSYNEIAIYENDLLLNRSMTEEFTYSNENYHYNSSLILKNDIKINQTKGDIKIPNLNDYRH